MKNSLHLICNAHIDPMWQWEWEEGAAEAVSTFRVAAQFCRDFDGFIFCHNEAILYEWIEEYEPALFREIQALVKEGKWHIMGGWHLQPDCNMPSGEGIVRNVLAGRTYFAAKFGKAPTTAINFDPFGHSRGLVQILAKAGFDSYLFCRPDQNDCPLPSDTFTWVGYDGSTVIGARGNGGYNSPRGNAVGKINGYVEETKKIEGNIHFCLWGVGNHGGGPSKKDLSDIAQAIPHWEADGVSVIHSTPEAFFSALVDSGKPLPRHEGDLNRWAVGCYTSQVRIKQKYRELENTYFLCEKMCSALSASTDFVYPEKELKDALHDLINIQFHDAIPGSSIQPVEEMCLRMADHGLEILSRVRARAFFALCSGQISAKDGEIPVLCYNPHPYPVEDDFSVEFMLADQNWSGTHTIPVVYRGDEKIPSQLEKEQSNIPLDWRKKVVFHATLEPMQITRFDCRLHTVPSKPIPTLAHDDTHYLFQNDRMQVKISRQSGLIDSCVVDGKEYFKPGAFSIDVYRDNEDPWGMTINGWYEKIGAFSLLSPEDGTKLSSLPHIVDSVRIIEDGEVRTVVEAVFGYSDSAAVVRYHLSKTKPEIALSLRIRNAETRKLFKLALPFAQENTKATAEVIYGSEPLVEGGIENPGQKYIHTASADCSMTVFNRGSYGSSFADNSLLLTIMRSPSYTAHPLGDRPILPSDRHSAWSEQGERLFDFKFVFATVPETDGLEAQVYNEQPITLSFFPSGHGQAAQSDIIRLDNRAITMTAFKRAEDQNGYLIRLFNNSATEQVCTVFSKLSPNTTFTFKPYEVKSIRFANNSAIEVSLLEKPRD